MNDESVHPWLVGEKVFLRDFILNVDRKTYNAARAALDYLLGALVPQQ